MPVEKIVKLLSNLQPRNSQDIGFDIETLLTTHEHVYSCSLPFNYDGRGAPDHEQLACRLGSNYIKKQLRDRFCAQVIATVNMCRGEAQLGNSVAINVYAPRRPSD